MIMIWNWLWSYWEGKRNLNLNLHIRVRTRSMVYTIRLSLWFFLHFHLGREKGRRRGSFMEEKKVENEGGRISYDGSALPSPHRGMSFFFSIAFSLSLALCLLAWLDGSGGGGRSGRDPYFSKKIDAKRRRRREEKTGEGRRGEKPLRVRLWIGIRCILGLPVPSTSFTSADGYKY